MYTIVFHLADGTEQSFTPVDSVELANATEVQFHFQNSAVYWPIGANVRFYQIFPAP